MGLLDFLFKAKNTSAEKKKPVIKEYTFSVAEIVCSGDRYEYKVKGKNREEAFKALVIYFFGEASSTTGKENIESSSAVISVPGNDRFMYSGMPKWFAKRISGHVRNHNTNKDYQKDLEKYCIDNNIELDRFHS